jgi:hypothetical protein
MQPHASFFEDEGPDGDFALGGVSLAFEGIGEGVDDSRG